MTVGFLHGALAEIVVQSAANLNILAVQPQQHLQTDSVLFLEQEETEVCLISHLLLFVFLRSRNVPCFHARLNSSRLTIRSGAQSKSQHK